MPVATLGVGTERIVGRSTSGVETGPRVARLVLARGECVFRPGGCPYYVSSQVEPVGSGVIRRPG
jgi:hypothetical protein